MPLSTVALAVAAFVLVVQAFYVVLDRLNLQYAGRQVRSRAEWVRTELGVEDVEDLLAYLRARTVFSQASSWTTTVVVLAVFVSGAFGWAVERLQGTTLPPFVAGAALLVAGTVGLSVLSLPFSAYSTFRIEEAFGFNNMDGRTWARQEAISIVVGAVLTGVLAGVLFFVVGRLPTWWPVAGVVVYVAFALLMQVVYPRVIAPLFNDFEPVADEELETAIEDLFERAGFACEEIYVMDASKQSAKSNAYFIGFGRTKRVVLFDTLLESMTLPEVEAVLAHELAHWKQGHIWQRLGLGTLEVAVVFGVLAVLSDASWLYDAFATPHVTWAGIVLAGLVVRPLLRLASPVTNRLSLANERAADDFAADLVSPTALADALRSLGSENYANPFPHPLYETFHADHPPIPERIRRLEGGDDPDAASSAVAGD